MAAEQTWGLEIYYSILAAWGPAISETTCYGLRKDSGNNRGTDHYCIVGMRSEAGVPSHIELPKTLMSKVDCPLSS